MNSASVPRRENNHIKKAVYLVLFLWAVLAIIFAFYDLEISISVVNTQSKWAKFIERYGEIPGLLVIVIAVFIIKTNRKRSKTLKEAGISFVLILTISFFSYYIVVISIGHSLGNLEFFSSYGAYFLALTGIFIWFIQRGLKHKSKKFPTQFETFAKIAFGIAICNYLFFVQLCKILWGRVRFYDLGSFYSNYTPWYLPQGITGNSSFPSAHAALGWMLLPLFLLVMKRSWKIKVIIGILIISWGLAVALGRLKIGAHYASDILFPTGLTLLCLILFYQYYYFRSKPGKSL